MGGGLLQLVAYGAQDVYITGNPQVTFFKLVYRRHTNFSLEHIEQTFNGNPDFGKRVTCTLSRNGDLIHKIWLWVKLPQVTVDGSTTTEFRWLNFIGHLLIDWVEFEIGGQRIDKQYGEWMQVYSELSLKPGHAAGYANMIGNVPALTNVVTTGTVGPAEGVSLYIPLQFYFCRNPGLSVPLVALQYHEVKINVEFRPVAQCCHYLGVVPSTAVMAYAALLVEYVFLDSDERRRFAQVSHEYLITQLQFTGAESTTTTSNKFKLAFNHPTKELIWTSTKEQFTKSSADGGPRYGRQWFNFSTKEDTTYLTGTSLDPLGGGIGFGGNDWLRDAALSNLYTSPSYDLSAVANAGENPTLSAKLVLNGHDRFEIRDGRWFNLAIPYCTHENIPPTGINVYSFALRPEEHQPSGSINFSRIDTANMHINLSEDAVSDGGAKVRIYAVNYNILRIMSGMGGLAYSN
ncbi:major capsid protein [Tetraselmis virus 1]|uniref:Major capsid protein n=1 Tax=Tetraselmis virus 1 TaxID=2060617 RepID=A0A2P0VMH4_9VIRU|nr:major capsid protein [Tetraselmis virus 1]AUF82093.1 major capsid protein [Tetraselmis virus 1]